MKNIQNLLQSKQAKTARLSEYFDSEESATAFFYERQSEGVSDIYSIIRNTIIGDPSDDGVGCSDKKQIIDFQEFQKCL